MNRGDVMFLTFGVLTAVDAALASSFITGLAAVCLAVAGVLRVVWVREELAAVKARAVFAARLREQADR